MKGITRRQEDKDYDRKRLMQKKHEVEGGRDSKCILIRRERSRAMQGRRFEKNDPKLNEQRTDGCKKNREAEMREGRFDVSLTADEERGGWCRLLGLKSQGS